MGIEANYNSSVTVKRLTDVEETDNETYDIYLTDVPCHIQPLDEGFTEDMTGSFGKDSLLFCAVTDIKEEDLIIDGDNSYRVIGISSFTWRGVEKHMEVRIRLFNP